MSASGPSLAHARSADPRLHLEPALGLPRAGTEQVENGERLAPGAGQVELLVGVARVADDEHAHRPVEREHPYRGRTVGRSQLAGDRRRDAERLRIALRADLAGTHLPVDLRHRAVDLEHERPPVEHRPEVVRDEQPDEHVGELLDVAVTGIGVGHALHELRHERRVDLDDSLRHRGGLGDRGGVDLLLVEPERDADRVRAAPARSGVLGADGVAELASLPALAQRLEALAHTFLDELRGADVADEGGERSSPRGEPGFAAARTAASRRSVS